MNLRILLVLFFSMSLSGCGYWNYQKTDTGKFGGDIEVRWIKPNQFLFLPAKDNPFYYERAGRRIQPKAMYTDGGTIPQLIWNVPGYSPWGYAPAYIIHDWIFVAHHCNDQEDGDFTFEESAKILSEGIKTIMENNVAPKNYFTHYTISKAVKSKVAENYWDDSKYKDEGKCSVKLNKFLIQPTLITIIRGEELNR